MPVSAAFCSHRQTQRVIMALVAVSAQTQGRFAP
jgi:hypothetical protein